MAMECLRPQVDSPAKLGHAYGVLCFAENGRGQGICYPAALSGEYLLPASMALLRSVGSISALNSQSNHGVWPTARLKKVYDNFLVAFADWEDLRKGHWSAAAYPLLPTNC